MKTTLQLAETAYKRARTRHLNEQARGEYNLSPQQTKRMYYAVGAMQRAYRRLLDAKRENGGN